MPILQSAYHAARAARSAGSVIALTPEQRRLWLVGLNAQAHRLWPDLRDDGRGGRRVTLDQRPRRANGGYLLRGCISDGDKQRGFWIKWCPEASREELDATVVHMKWWRCVHPNLRAPVADILAYWAEENVLLLEDKPGIPLGSAIRDTEMPPVAAKPVPLESVVSDLAGWMADFARGQGHYDETTREHWGDEVQRSEDGTLTVNARHLLEQRLALADSDVSLLKKAGLPVAGDWQQRFDIDAILRSFTQPTVAGFIHGDFKPDNVLVDGSTFSIIDWWNSPKISWALSDVASFAANCWLGDSNPNPQCPNPQRPSPRQMWCIFAKRYFESYDDSTQNAVDLLATMACLRLLARMANARGARGWVNRLRAPRMLRRVINPETRVGSL